MGKQSRRKAEKRKAEKRNSLVLVTRVGTPGLEGYDLTGYELIRCHTCRAECWISPQSRDMAEKTDTRIVAVCSECGGGDNAIGAAAAAAMRHGVPMVFFRPGS
jgi:hypothetical protein